MNVTISQIAKEAGVSKSTVSRVLNDHPSVLPETKFRVKEVIAQYHFQPNVYARSMAKRRSHCLGLVIPHEIDYTFKNQFYSEIQRIVLKTAKQNQYFVLLICSANMQEAIDLVAEGRVDGLIVVSPRVEQSQTLSHLAERKVPFVTIGQIKTDVPTYQVCTNNYDGAVLAMNHLFGLGHRRIGYINGPHYLPSSVERYRAYWDSMTRQKYSITAGLVQEGNNSIESGYTAASAILMANPDVTAIFVGSDYMAIGVQSAVRDAGLQIPGDISIIGFDNIPISEQLTPALSTIDQNIEEKGRYGVETLIELINGEESEKVPVREIPPVLVVRGSTGIVRKKKR